MTKLFKTLTKVAGIYPTPKGSLILISILNNKVFLDLLRDVDNRGKENFHPDPKGCLRCVDSNSW